MTLDIRGSIKNTKLSTNPYVVFEELISNAIDSYLIRKDAEASAPPLDVRVEVVFRTSDLFGDQEVMSIRCSDNGCGLGDDQLKAFLTKDTSYKDDLHIAGIGKCKGAGRIQYFHYFGALSIDSTFRRGQETLRRRLNYAEPTKQIDFEDFSEEPGAEADIGTTLSLGSFKETARPRFAGAAPSSLFAAAVLKRQMLMAFLQRLVGLDERLGDFTIAFSSRHGDDDAQTEALNRADLPKVTATKSVEIEERNPSTGDGAGLNRASGSRTISWMPPSSACPRMRSPSAPNPLRSRTSPATTSAPRPSRTIP